MKQYGIYITNASNQNRLVLKDCYGKPFYTKEEAHEYGNGITNNTVVISEREAFDKSREEILLSNNIKKEGNKHNSLYDAKVIKSIYNIICK